MEINKGQLPENKLVLAIVKFGVIELGHLRNNIFQTTRNRQYNPSDILAFVDLSEIESEFAYIFQDYINSSNQNLQ